MATDLGQRTVYFGNLAWAVSWHDLKDFCKPCGEIEHAEVLSYKDGRKTGSGIVRFATVEGAQKAIKTLQDQDLKGRPIFCREDKEGGKGPGSVAKGKGKALSEEKAACQVFVGNLSFRTSWQDLKDHFKHIGDIEYCDILVDHGKESKGKFRSAGAGLIRFKDPAHAKIAIETMSDTDLDDRQIFVREDREGREIKGKSAEMKGWGYGFGKKGKDSWGKGKGKGKSKGKKGKGAKEYTIWIPNVDSDTTWKDLKDAFTEAGFSPSHTAVRDGGGLVKFLSEEQAQAAIDGMWEKKIGESVIKPDWLAEVEQPSG